MSYIVKREGKKGVSYLVRYRAPDGTLRSKTFRRKVDAQNFLEEVGTDIRRKGWADPRLARTPFAEVAQRWVASRRDVRPSTAAREEIELRVHLTPHFGKAPIGAVGWEDIEAFIAEELENLAPATVKRSVSTLGQIFKFALKAGYVVTNPCDLIDPISSGSRGEDVFLTPDELNALASAIHPRFQAMVLLSGYRGLRFGEAAGLKTSRLNLLLGYLEVREILTEVGSQLSFGPPKTEEGARRVSLPNFLIEALGNHLNGYPPAGGVIFTGPDQGLLRRSNFARRFWRPAVKVLDAEKQRITFHGLRHTAVSLLVAEGASIIEIGGIMGWSKHSIPAMAARYGHLYPSRDAHLTEAVERMYRETAHKSRTNSVIALTGQEEARS